MYDGLKKWLAYFILSSFNKLLKITWIWKNLETLKLETLTFQLISKVKDLMKKPIVTFCVLKSLLHYIKMQI